MTTRSAETIRIESESRRDALDLVRRLPHLHTYLVQLGNRRWHVCVKTDGAAEELVPAVLRTAAEWASERNVKTMLHVGDRSYEVRA